MVNAAITLKEFEELSSEMESKLFDLIEISDIVENTIKVCKFFTKKLPLPSYIEMHGTSLSYFSSLKKYLSNKKIFTDQNLQEGFQIAFRCEKLIPRLYTALMIACASEDEAQISTVIDSLQGVTHPLRGIVLRFTAISFFPRKSKLLVSFAQKNFEEMLYLLPKFLALFPNSISEASGWLTSNISIALFICNKSDEMFNYFFNLAKNFVDTDVAINVVSSLEQNIEQEVLLNHFKDFQDFINGIEVSESTSIIVDNIIKHCEKASYAFEFISKIKFKDEKAIILTQRSIDQKDYVTLRKCAETWPIEDVFSLIFSACGHNLFVALVPALPQGAEISQTFIKTATSEVLPSALRKILENEMSKRSESLNKLLIDFICTNKLSKSFLEVVFAPPFSSNGERMTKMIVFQCLRENMQSSFIEELIKTSENCSNEVLVSLLCEALPETGFDTIAKYITTEKCAQIFLRHFFSFKVDKESLPIITQHCTTRESKMFCANILSIASFNEEAEELLSSCLYDDSGMNVNQRLNSYFNIMSTAAGLHQFSPNLGEFVKTIIAKCCEIIKIANDSIFPISVPETILKWLRILSSVTKLTEIETVELSDLLNACLNK